MGSNPCQMKNKRHQQRRRMKGKTNKNRYIQLMQNYIYLYYHDLPHEVHVSEKTVPCHLLQIQPLEGSNCIIMGLRALVRTLSLIRSSNKFTVEACSIIDSGVVKTMCRAVEEYDDDDSDDDFEYFRSRLCACSNCIPLLF